MENITPEDVALIIGAIITGANAITAAFPSRGASKYYNYVMKVFNILSVNFGHNKNADDK